MLACDVHPAVCDQRARLESVARLEFPTQLQSRDVGFAERDVLRLEPRAELVVREGRPVVARRTRRRGNGRLGRKPWEEGAMRRLRCGRSGASGEHHECRKKKCKTR